MNEIDELDLKFRGTINREEDFPKRPHTGDFFIIGKNMKHKGQMFEIDDIIAYKISIEKRFLFFKKKRVTIYKLGVHCKDILVND